MIIKTHVIAVVLVIISVNSIPGQYSAGIFGGVNNSGLIGDAPQGTTYRDRTGFETGALVEYRITSDVGISLQPMFIEKGVKIAYSVFSEREPRDSIKLSINYFSVPVLVKVYADNDIIYVSGGFDLGYKLDASFKRIGSDTEKEVTDAFRDFNIAAVVGVGAQFRLSQFYIFVEGRYSQGLGNISSPDPDDPKEINPSFRTSGVQLFAGIIYSFGRRETGN